MKINKTELQNALEIVKPGLANKEVIEQSASFAFIEGHVVTYNDTISVSHPIKGLEFEGAVRAEELYQFLRRTNKEEIELAPKENEVVMKAGNAKAGLSFQQQVVLPIEEISGEKKWKKLPDKFCENIDFAKDSTSKDMSRRILTCVHVTKEFVEASDSFQILRTDMNGFPFKEALIPAEVITDIVKIKPTKVAEGEGWLHFKNDQGTVLSSRVLAAEFPDTSSLLDLEGIEVTFPKKMNEILDRAMVFTKKEHELDEEMEVIIKEGKLKVHGKNEYGWFREQAKINYNNDPISFWIAPSLLKNILSRSNTCIVGEDKLRFNGDGWCYVAVLRDMANENEE